ncbi:MAG: Uma2 family endonuclease [Planctomycetia bacterium]|nr:Uma2 family endonuclease [Planctomycetia bacterium]
MATIVETKLEDAICDPLAEQAELFLASRRFTPDEYMSMAQAGILDEDERLELLEGAIIKMMVRYPEHDYSILKTEEALRKLCSADHYVRVQMGIATSDSRPEPDCAFTRGKMSDHAHRFPEGQEIELIVEVADSSLRCDRGIKARIYARAGVPVYWILNLKGRQLEVFSDPTGDVEQPAYRKSQVFMHGEKAPLLLGGKQVGEIAVAELLP